MEKTVYPQSMNAVFHKIGGNYEHMLTLIVSTVWTQTTVLSWIAYLRPVFLAAPLHMTVYERGKLTG